MTIMWVLLCVGLAFVLFLRFYIARMRKFERLANERRAQIARIKAAREAAARAAARDAQQ